MRGGCPAEAAPALLDAMLNQARLASAGLCSTSEFGGRTVPGNEESAHRCLYDIENFIFCQLKLKRRFAGKCGHIINIMRRYPDSIRIQTVGCSIVDKLALNENLRPELGATDFPKVVLRLLRDMKLEKPATSADSSIATLMFHAFGALSSLSLDCPSNVKTLHELGVAGALLDAFKPHFHPECGRETTLANEFLTCVASLARQDEDLRDLFCSLGCLQILRDAVASFEQDSRMVRQACFCIRSLVEGNAANVAFFMQEQDIAFLRRNAFSTVLEKSVTGAALAAMKTVVEAVEVMSHEKSK